MLTVVSWTGVGGAISSTSAAGWDLSCSLSAESGARLKDVALSAEASIFSTGDSPQFATLDQKAQGVQPVALTLIETTTVFGSRQVEVVPHLAHIPAVVTVTTGTALQTTADTDEP